MEQNRSRKICRNSNKKGVPKEKIYLEKNQQTQETTSDSQKIIEKANLKIKTCIVVCKPYGEKRVYAAFKKYYQNMKYQYTQKTQVMKNTIKAITKNG